MPETQHQKLVRDRIPAIIRSRGEQAHTVVLPPADFTTALLDKLVEESVELRTARSQEQLDELADVWEVLTTVVADLGYTLEEIEQAASFKRIVRGGFAERVWLESTSDDQAVRI